MTGRLLAFMLALAVLPGAACAAAPRLVSAGLLTWGTSPTFAPFEFQRDNKSVGFDVDMMADLARRIGLKSSMLGMDFAGIVPALAAHRIDAAVSGMYITPARLKVVDFIPYLKIGNQIVVPAANPAHLAARSDLCGHRVAVAVSTAFEQAAEAESATCKAAGRKAITLLTLPNSAVVALALRQGRAEAALSSNATVAAMISQNPGVFLAVGKPFDTSTRLGIGVAKDNPALLAALTGALTAMEHDGTYMRLLKKWSLPPDSSIF